MVATSLYRKMDRSAVTSICKNLNTIVRGRLRVLVALGAPIAGNAVRVGSFRAVHHRLRTESQIGVKKKDIFL